MFGGLSIAVSVSSDRRPTIAFTRAGSASHQPADATRCSRIVSRLRATRILNSLGGTVDVIVSLECCLKHSVFGPSTQSSCLPLVALENRTGSRAKSCECVARNVQEGGAHESQFLDGAVMLPSPVENAKADVLTRIAHPKFAGEADQ